MEARLITAQLVTISLSLSSVVRVAN